VVSDGKASAPASSLAAVATRSRCFLPAELALVDVAQWRSLRDELEQRLQQRAQQRRFRQDPENYLADLEARLVKSILLP